MRPLTTAIALTLTLTLTLLATPATAQDGIDFNGALDHARTTGRMVRQAQAREAHRPNTTRNDNARRRQTCLNARAMLRAGNRHPDLPTLVALCRRAGY